MIGPVNHLHVEDLANAMAERGFEVLVAGNAESYLPPTRLPSQGIPVYPAPPAPHDTIPGVIANVRWIRRLRRYLKPDVVHAHWLCGFAAFSSLARAQPLVSMAWGSDVLRATRIKNVANRIALRGSSLAIADSQQLLDRMIEMGMPPTRVARVSWGVDLDHFTPATETREELRARLQLGSGRIVLGPRSTLPLYNPDTIIDAFACIADEFPDVRLVLLGLAAGDLDVAGRVDPARIKIVGRVPHDTMANYFRAADLFISIPSSDGSPRTVWEAMACQCPAILSDLPWVSELIVPGRDAFVVPINANAVADAIRQVLTEPQAADVIAANARALSIKHQSKDANMAKLADLYLSLARSKPSTP